MVKSWASGEDDHFVARAEFDFNGSGEEELSFRAGQLIKVAPKEIQPRMRGWLLASVDGQKVGIIPANYVKVLGKKRGTKHQTQSVPSNTGVPPATAVTSASTPDLLSGTSTCCKKTGAQSSNSENVPIKPAASAPCLDSVNSLEVENNSSFSNLEDAFSNDSNSGSKSNSEPENMNAKDILEATDNNLIN
ncbi:peroxisomal membrane protein PEX13-like [Saccostrea cucullata]|uniref:peroxisomal membrane protein PEX13-like n=1 Tax=Saccostrea cuccullata TaxID=36930 RepID=UPI002ED0BA5A